MILWHVRGSIGLNAAVDRPALMARIEQGLRAIGCELTAEVDRIHVASGSDGKYTPLAFVDGGDVWLEERSGKLALRYDMPTLRSLYLCLALSVVAGIVAWFNFGDDWLTWFAVAMPVVWLYGANYVTSAIRVPGRLRDLCAGRP